MSPTTVNDGRPLLHVDLDGDGVAVDAEQGGGGNETEHAALLGSMIARGVPFGAGLEALSAIVGTGCDDAVGVSVP